MEDQNWIDIACHIVNETELAIQIDDGDRTAWIPKSLIDSIDTGGQHCCDVVYIPEWLALEKGLI